MNPKIYMVMVDALRKDYAMTMKSYQLLCDHGVEFAAHRSTNRWTFPALGTVHSGRLTPEHGLWGWEPGWPVPTIKCRQTMAELLKEMGWSTVAFANTGWGKKIFGFDRGFDHYLDNGWWIKNLDAFVAETDKFPTPLFRFIHLLDVHEYFRREPWTMEDWRTAISKGISDEDADHLRELYAQMVHEFDQKLIIHFQTWLAEGATIIMFADHGEHLLDHNRKWHGHGNHCSVPAPCLLDLPLVIAGPLQQAGARIEYRTWDYDLMPTVIGLAAGLMEGECFTWNNGQAEGRSVFDGQCRFTPGVEARNGQERPGSVSPEEQAEVARQLTALGYLDSPEGQVKGESPGGEK